MIGRWHSSCLHRNRVDFSLHQTLFKRQLRHFFHNCLVGKSVAKKTWKTILFPKNVATKMYPSVLNWFFHEIMYFPKNTFMTNVFLWKYFYAWLYYDSLSQCAKINQKISFSLLSTYLSFHAEIGQNYTCTEIVVWDIFWGDFQTLCQSVLSRTFVIWSHVFRSRHDIFRK